MILYTPLAKTDVFPETGEDSANRQFVSYQGKTLYVEKRDNQSYELIQLLSTDPQDFLNNDFSPGTIL